jgi:hypothetical protein
MNIRQRFKWTEWLESDWQDHRGDRPWCYDRFRKVPIGGFLFDARRLLRVNFIHHHMENTKSGLRDQDTSAVRWNWKADWPIYSHLELAALFLPREAMTRQLTDKLSCDLTRGRLIVSKRALPGMAIGIFRVEKN